MGVPDGKEAMSDELVKVTFDQRDVRIVLAALDAYGEHLGSIVAFGNQVAVDLDGDVPVVDERLVRLSAKMADELGAIRERILGAITLGEDDEPETPSEQTVAGLTCWCGRYATARVDDLGLQVESPEGALLCEGHYQELLTELADADADAALEEPQVVWVERGDGSVEKTWLD